MPGCRGTVPFQLYGAETFDGESIRLSDEDAEALGYRALVEGNILVDGGCECADPPATPSCETGCSVWTLDRTVCEVETPGGYLYFWRSKDNACTGGCGEGDCVPTIPESPVLSLSGVVDEALAAMVGQDFVGGCECGATPYEIPECECPCTAITDAFAFTVSGVTGGNSYFNGSYSASPNAFFGDCAWYDASTPSPGPGDLDGSALLKWIGPTNGPGYWELTFRDPDSSTVKQYVSDEIENPCTLPATLNVVDAGGGWPSTISIDT